MKHLLLNSFLLIIFLLILEMDFTLCFKELYDTYVFETI